MDLDTFKKAMIADDFILSVMKEEGQDKHPTMLEKYLEKKANEKNGKLEEHDKKLIDENAKLLKEIEFLRKKLQEEQDYQEYLKKRRTKGQCAGYKVIGISEVIERGARDHALTIQAKLRKLINNPALSDDVKNTLADARSLIDSYLFWKNQCLRLREKEKAGS